MKEFEEILPVLFLRHILGLLPELRYGDRTHPTGERRIAVADRYRGKAMNLSINTMSKTGSFRLAQAPYYQSVLRSIEYRQSVPSIQKRSGGTLPT